MILYIHNNIYKYLLFSILHYIKNIVIFILIEKLYWMEQWNYVWNNEI